MHTLAPAFTLTHKLVHKHRHTDRLRKRERRSNLSLKQSLLHLLLKNGPYMYYTIFVWIHYIQISLHKAKKNTDRMDEGNHELLQQHKVKYF